MESMESQALLTAIKIGAYALPNRILMSPLTRSRANNPDSAPTALHAEYYAQRAGAGIIITEGSQISEQARGYAFTPGIHSAAQIAGWKQVTDAVHAKDGRIFIQLWHCGRISHSYFHNGAAPVAPSAIRAESGNCFTDQGIVRPELPRALTLAEIKAIIEDYRQAAKNAQLAGFDGVQLHGANGYLVDQFLHESSNQRSDEYGGSLENRARFLFEVLDALLSVWGADKVAVRLSPSGIRGFDSVDTDPVSIFEYVIDQLNNYPLAFLELVEPLDPVTDKPQMVQKVAPHFRPFYRGTLVSNGGYTQETANQAIQEGIADAIAFGKAFIANPDLPTRFARNAPLNAWNQATFYGGTAVGYTDYPALV
jgi:N-ethylmaleimide reductase